MTRPVLLVVDDEMPRLADLNYWRRTGSSVRLTTAPHVQVIHTRSLSPPPSISPHRRCSPRKATKLARSWLNSPRSGSSA